MLVDLKKFDLNMYPGQKTLLSMSTIVKIIYQVEMYKGLYSFQEKQICLLGPFSEFYDCFSADRYCQYLSTFYKVFLERITVLSTYFFDGRNEQHGKVINTLKKKEKIKTNKLKLIRGTIK